MIKKIISITLILSLSLSFAYTFDSKVYARPTGSDENRAIYQPTDDPVYYYQPPVDENGNHDYFGYEIFDDPQDITDEEFFGSWDEIGQVWISKPYFRYSEFPGMANVEAAAKEGNYKLAKSELLNYYKGLNDRGDTISNASSVSWKYEGYLNSLSRNIFAYYVSPAEGIGDFTIPANDWSKVEIDVTNYVESAKGTFADFNVMIASADKFWTTAEIYSKDAEDESVRPVLRMVVNGVNREFEVIKDAKIVAGTMGTANFGYDPVMQVQEHGCYDNTNESMGTYDADTSRVMIDFDISDLNASDSVTSATVVLTARTVITDETRERFADEQGNPYSGEVRDKLMWAQWYSVSNWEEDTVTWKTESIADKQYFSCHDMVAWDYVTSSDTNYKGKTYQYHRNTVIPSLRYPYLYYNDERYAYTLIRQEMALINSIGLETQVMNALDMSTHLTGLCESFYALLSSEYMTPEVCTAFLKFIWQLSDWEVEAFFGTRDNNWATFASSAVYMSLCYFQEWTTCDYWYDKVIMEHNRCLSGMTLEDGLCIELSLDYVKTLLGTFSAPIETYTKTNYLAPYSDELYEDMHDIVRTLLYSAGPYFGGFNIGNDTGGPYTSRKSTIEDWYYMLFGDDEELAWAATDGKNGAAPEIATTRYPTSLRTYMRSSWEKDALQMSFVNTMIPGISHGHNDALSVAMFAYGKFLLVDNGYAGDLTSDEGRQYEYFRSPVQHNLVTINDTYDYINDGIENATGVVDTNSSWENGFESNKYYDYVEYATEAFTTAQKIQRSITFLKNQKMWIISDYALPTDPSVENVFAQHWHLYPGADQTVDENYQIMSHFPDVNVMVIPLETQTIDDYQFVDSYYSEAKGQIILNKKTMFTKTKTGDAKFTTLIIPVNYGEDFEVMSTSISNNNDIDDDLLNMAYFKVTETNSGASSYYYYYHLNDTELMPECGVKVAEYTTDATTFLIQLNENKQVISVFLVDGSYIKSDSIDGGYLFKADENTTISFRKNGQFVNVMSSLYKTSEELKGVSLYMPTAKAAVLDETEVGIDTANGYVTFNGTYSSGNVSSGGSSGGGGGGASVKPPVQDETEKEDVKPIEPVTPITPDVIPSYDDVDETKWFFEYVEELTKRGIVSGDGSGNFAPNDNVTREQFLKMLLVAAEIKVNMAENTFTDVSEDDWFAQYVLTAKNLGIVNGISSSKFGIGSYITRQDMAVMISRLIRNTGVETEEKEVDAFADEDSVSEYAKDSVTLMKSIGLIEGYNNEYRPLDNLTRAEASKVIFELLELL